MGLMLCMGVMRWSLAKKEIENRPRGNVTTSATYPQNNIHFSLYSSLPFQAINEIERLGLGMPQMGN